MSSDRQVGQGQPIISDRDKVDRIAATIESLMGLLDGYATELEAELALINPETDARLISLVRGQQKEVRRCLERVEEQPFEHVLRMKDRAFLLPKARAGILL